MSLPVVKRDEKGIPTLYVHDRPFFMRSGEIHNSSASDPVYLEEKLWPALRGMNMNAAIVPVYWELIEPTEGAYDFSLVEKLILAVTAPAVNDVILSCVPGWMDMARRKDHKALMIDTAERSYSPAYRSVEERRIDVCPRLGQKGYRDLFPRGKSQR